MAPAWVGDAVLAQPLFKRLRERHQQLELDVLAPAWTHALFARMPEVNATLESPFGHGELALACRYRLARDISARHYDQAVILPNSFKSALIPFLARIPVRTGYVGEARWGLLNDARRLDKKALPLMVERFAALALAPGEALARPLPAARLKVDETHRNATLARLGLASGRALAVLCPGAEFGPAKRWPPQTTSPSSRANSPPPVSTVWIAGSAKDAAIGDEIARLSDGQCINLCGKDDARRGDRPHVVRHTRGQQRFGSDAHRGGAR